MKKVIATCLIATTLLTGCSTTNEETTNKDVNQTTSEETANKDNAQESANNGKNIIVDDLGREVEIPEKLERIVIADLPPLVHAVYTVNGGTEGIIGAPSTYALDETLFPIVYPEVLELETGFRQNGQINIEELMSLNPDLILYRSDNEESAKLIQSTGVPAVAFQTTNGDNGNVVTPVASWIEDLAQILGKDINDITLEKDAYSAMGFVQSRVWDIKEQNTSAYVTATPEGIKMLGEGQFGSFWAKISNTKDLGASEFTGSKEISVEQLYAYNPDVIYLGLGSMSAEEFLKDPRFQNLEAVKNKRVYKAPEGLFSWFGPSTDIPLSFLWHAKVAYPEYFKDIDVVDITIDYYKEKYNYELTQEDLERLFANSIEELHDTE